MKKVGILGGTFNPIHCGHIHLAERALKEAGLDQVLFIPSGVSYMKDQNEILPAHHRLEMVRLAIAEHPAFAVSDIEIQKAGNSYSHETIKALQEQYPDVRFFFLTGADTIFSIESWKDPVSIFRAVTILAAYREGRSLKQLLDQIDYLKGRYDADIRLIAADHVDVSSSELRAAIRNAEAVDSLLPQPVREYIAKYHLYQATETQNQGYTV